MPPGGGKTLVQLGALVAARRRPGGVLPSQLPGIPGRRAVVQNRLFGVPPYGCQPERPVRRIVLGASVLQMPSAHALLRLPELWREPRTPGEPPCQWDWGLRADSDAGTSRPVPIAEVLLRPPAIFRLASLMLSAPPVESLLDSHREYVWLPTNDDQTGLRARHNDRPRTRPRVAS
jgi:hypothetical protein